jgi:hypothetical protein
VLCRMTHETRLPCFASSVGGRGIPKTVVIPSEGAEEAAVTGRLPTCISLVGSLRVRLCTGLLYAASACESGCNAAQSGAAPASSRLNSATDEYLSSGNSAVAVATRTRNSAGSRSMC